MDDVIRNKVMMLIDFSMEEGIDGIRRWSAIARAFVLALVYLADSIQASTAQTAGAQEDGET